MNQVLDEPPRFPWQRPDFGAIPELDGVGREPFRAVTTDGQPIWIITSIRQVRSLLIDHRLSADIRRESFPRLGGVLLEGTLPVFMRTDAPEHAVVRRVVAPLFSKPAVLARLGVMQTTADELIAGIESRTPRRADLIGDFVVPFAMRIVLDIAGLPQDAWYELSEATSAYMTANPLTDRQQMRRLLGAGKQMTEIINAAIADSDDPSEDCALGRLLSAVDAGTIGENAIVPTLFLLLVAGHDTSAGTLGGLLELILDDPQLKARLLAHPADIPAATEEALRFLSVVHGLVLRTVLADITIDETTLRAGDGVALMLHSANHDAGAFERPQEYDIDRDSRGHVAFGHGAHRCLGHTLARFEINLALRTLLEQLPDLRALERKEDRLYKPTSPIQGLQRLMVEF